MRDWEINHYYLVNTCKVVDKTVQSHEDLGSSKSFKRTTLYQALIHINYQVDQFEYSKWISPSGMSTSSVSMERAIFNQYQIGHEYSCWYNPNNLSDVVLQRGYSYVRITLSMIFIIVALILFRTKYTG